MRKFSLLMGIFIIVCAFYLFFPRAINLDAQGLKYKLGAASGENEQIVNVHIQGKMYRSMTGNKTFKGIIELDDEKISASDERSLLEVNFYKSNVGVITYHNIQDTKPVIYTFGSIYLDNDFNKATIAVLDHKGDQGIWTGEDGIMITAPAVNRSEAIDISNELMKDHLNSYKLK